MTYYEQLTNLARQTYDIKMHLKQIQPNITRYPDNTELNRIITELAWITENLSVIAHHEIGQSQDDKMGYDS